MSTYAPGELDPNRTGSGSLSSVLGFDTPCLIVEDDGSVRTDHLGNYHAPSAYAQEDGADWLDDVDWTFFSAGYTGQHGYSGPVMHASELLTGRLAETILETPGVYAAVVVWAEIVNVDAEESSQEPAGWAIVRRDV